MSVAANLFDDNRFCLDRKFIRQFPKSPPVFHISTKIRSKNVVSPRNEQVFRRHHTNNDPVNWIDPDGLRKKFVFQNGTLSFYGDKGELLFRGPATSGPWGKGALPKGLYGVGAHRDNRTGSYACPNSAGYSVNLDPQFSTPRTDLRIHPDGGVPGTLGCIGVNCSDGSADSLGGILIEIYSQPMTPAIDLEVQ